MIVMENKAVKENPSITLKVASLLELKVDQNTATKDDYELIEFFLKILGAEKEVLLNKLKEKNIYSFEQFIEERKNPKRDILIIDGNLLGTILGATSYIIEYAKRNNL
jgi:hypothetical protein